MKDCWFELAIRRQEDTKPAIAWANARPNVSRQSRQVNLTNKQELFPVLFWPSRAFGEFGISAKPPSRMPGFYWYFWL